MVGAGFHSIAKLHAQIPPTATTILSPWHWLSNAQRIANPRFQA
jgi:hypothetical protein